MSPPRDARQLSNRLLDEGVGRGGVRRSARLPRGANAAVDQGPGQELPHSRPRDAEGPRRIWRCVLERGRSTLAPPFKIDELPVTLLISFQRDANLFQSGAQAMRRVVLTNESPAEVLISVSLDDLHVLQAALREINQELEDWEFEVRMGVTRQALRDLLQFLSRETDRIASGR